MTVVSMSYLLEAGVHFGHQKEDGTLKWENIYIHQEMTYI